MSGQQRATQHPILEPFYRLLADLKEKVGSLVGSLPTVRILCAARVGLSSLPTVSICRGALPLLLGQGPIAGTPATAHPVQGAADPGLLRCQAT